MCFVFLKIKIYSCSCTAVWIALKMGGLASNWKLSGIPCHFDLVIFFTFFLYFLSDLPPCLHISSLFILLPCLSHLLSFHHCVISHSQPVAYFSLSTFLSTTIFTCLCDMTGGPVNGDCDRCRWVCDTEKFRTALLHIAFQHAGCHARCIDIIVRLLLDILECTHESCFCKSCLCIKYFGIERCYTDNKDAC